MPSPTRAVRPLLFASALYVVAGGVVHLMQWTDGYRRIPSEVAGSWLVRDGFPLNALVSFLGAAALVWMLVRPTARLVPIVAANLTLQIGSLTLPMRSFSPFDSVVPLMPDSGIEVTEVCVPITCAL